MAKSADEVFNMHMSEELRCKSKERIQELRAKLIEAEQAGFTDQSVDDIWSEARNSTHIG